LDAKKWWLIFRVAILIPMRVVFLGDINRSRRVIERFARYFTDFLIPMRTDHTLEELLAISLHYI
jgi:hypothetical protein